MLPTNLTDTMVKGQVALLIKSTQLKYQVVKVSPGDSFAPFSLPSAPFSHIRRHILVIYFGTLFLPPTSKGNVFTLVCLSVHTCGRGGGYLSQVRTGGNSSQVWMGRGYPRSGQGVPHSQVWTGATPFPGLDRGYFGDTSPTQVRMGLRGEGVSRARRVRVQGEWGVC